MKTLEEHNAERRAHHDAMQRAMTKQQKNGIACPKCGSELYDCTPQEMQLSSPPQKAVRCTSCTFSGYRLA